MFARAMPASRVLFIVRHPCGQVASVMRGARKGHFELRRNGTNMPYDEAQALAWAGRHGVGQAAFLALPDAAKYAWSWRAFNEIALAELQELPNARVVVYEELCAEPEALSRDILAFIGLDWNPQTAAFVMRSSRHEGQAGYYAVYRSSAAAADSWRSSMTVADCETVMAVARDSPLTRFWPNLAGGLDLSVGPGKSAA
jgi:hypothetical protein